MGCPVTMETSAPRQTFVRTGSVREPRCPVTMEMCVRLGNAMRPPANALCLRAMAVPVRETENAWEKGSALDISALELQTYVPQVFAV